MQLRVTAIFGSCACLNDLICVGEKSLFLTADRRLRRKYNNLSIAYCHTLPNRAQNQLYEG